MWCRHVSTRQHNQSCACRQFVSLVQGWTAELVGQHASKNQWMDWFVFALSMTSCNSPLVSKWPGCVCQWTVKLNYCLFLINCNISISLLPCSLHRFLSFSFSHPIQCSNKSRTKLLQKIMLTLMGNDVMSEFTNGTKVWIVHTVMHQNNWVIRGETAFQTLRHRAWGRGGAQKCVGQKPFITDMSSKLFRNLKQSI